MDQCGKSGRVTREPPKFGNGSKIKEESTKAMKVCKGGLADHPRKRIKDYIGDKVKRKGRLRNTWWLHELIVTGRSGLSYAKVLRSVKTRAFWTWVHLWVKFKFDENKSHDLYEEIVLSLCEVADVKGDDNWIQRLGLSHHKNGDLWNLGNHNPGPYGSTQTKTKISFQTKQREIHYGWQNPDWLSQLPTARTGFSYAKMRYDVVDIRWEWQSRYLVLRKHTKILGFFYKYLQA